MTAADNGSDWMSAALGTPRFRIYHIPHDVLCAAPLIGVENSPFGEDPMSFSEYVFGTFTSTLIGAGEFLYNGLVATASFMVDLTTSLTDIGMRVVASCLEAVQGVIDAVGEVAELIVDTFNAFVDWIVEFVQSTIDAVLGPLIDAVQGAIDTYCMGLASTLSMAIDEYGDGGVSPSTVSAFCDAVTGGLFQILLGLSMAVNVVLMVVTAATNVVGFLLTMAISLVVSYLVTDVLRMTGTSGGSPLSSNSTSGGLNLTGMEEDLSGAGVDTNTTDWASAWGAFSILAGKFASMIAYGAWCDSDYSRIGKVSLVFGLLSLAVCGTSLFAGDPLISTALSVTSLTFSIIGLGMSLIEMYGNIHLPTSGGVAFIVNAIAIVISGVGTCYAVDQLCHPEGQA